MSLLTGLGASTPARLSRLVRAGGYLRTSGWIRSARTRMAMDSQGNPIPWMTYPSIRFLEQRISPDMSVFEYGSGQSTLWWASRVATLIACEHDRKWFDAVMPRLPANTSVVHASLDESGAYASTVNAYGEGQFHIVVIDGRQRVRCAMNAVRALREDGVIIWDNNDRADYTEGYRHLASSGFRCLDFIGPGPLNAYGWSTGIYYRESNCLGI